MKNQLSIEFKNNDVNGRPSVRISSNSTVIYDFTFISDSETISIPVDGNISNIIEIERYGKTSINTTDEDQMLEIKSVKLNGIVLPEYITRLSTFKFDDQIHNGSMYFGPNGIWTLEFGRPLITWILDQKILNEDKFTDPAEYTAWSYKIQPGSREELIKEIELTESLVNSKL